LSYFVPRFIDVLAGTTWAENLAAYDLGIKLTGAQFFCDLFSSSTSYTGYSAEIIIDEQQDLIRVNLPASLTSAIAPGVYRANLLMQEAGGMITAVPLQQYCFRVR
jgi:hypothetical protein